MIELIELKEIKAEGYAAFEQSISENKKVVNPYNTLLEAVKFEAWKNGFQEGYNWKILVELNQKY